MPARKPRSLQNGVARPSRLKVVSSSEQWEKVDIHALILRLLTAHGPRFQEFAVQVEVKSENALPEIDGMSLALEKMLRIFIEQSLDSFAAMQSARPRVLNIELSCRPSGDVEILLEDNAEGMSGQDQRQVLLPFFSENGEPASRPREGLSVALEIINSHHGSLGMDTQSGQGSSFQIRIPIAH